MKRLCAIAAGLLATTALASAADFPAKAAPVAYIPPVVVNSWDGFYVGGHVGYGFGSDPVDQTGGTFAIGKTKFPISPPNLAVASQGVQAGIHGGYNWEFIPKFILGIEGDFNWDDVNGSSTATWSAAGASLSASASSKIDWDSSIRARLGYLITPTWLIYGTAGVAFGGATVNASTNLTIPGFKGCPAFCGAGSVSGTQTGWAGGLGFEYMMAQHWLVRAEWMHTDLGSIGGAYTTNLPLAATFNFSQRITDDAFRGGISYRF